MKRGVQGWTVVLLIVSLPVTLPAILVGIGIKSVYKKTKKTFRRRYPVKKQWPNESKVWGEHELKLLPESTPDRRVPPHDFLPPEIMSLIFIHLSDFYIEHRYEWDVEGCNTGLGWNKRLSVLKSVCKTWRVIADATPTLFRCFHFTVLDHGWVAAGEDAEVLRRRRLETLFGEAEAWLECSKQVDVDLYLHLELSGIRTKDFDVDVSNLLTMLLLGLAQRMRLLMYEGPTDILLGIFATTPLMGHLEELRIHYDNNSFYEPFPTILSPRLRTLTLGRRFQHRVLPSVDLSSSFPAYKQITRLHLSDSSTARQIIHSCPALIECIVYKNQYSRRSIYEAPEAPVVHRDLKRLELRTMADLPLGRKILYEFSLPSLQHLKIQNTASISPRSIQMPQVLEMYDRNPFPLKSLSLCHIPYIDTLAFLTRVEDTLVSIHMWECEISVTRILRYLTVSQPTVDENRCYNVMNLEELVVVNRSTVDAYPLAVRNLVEFVDSRLWEDSSPICETYGQRKLKKVVIRTNVRGEVHRKDLERWSEKGCVVTNRAPRVFT